MIVSNLARVNNVYQQTSAKSPTRISREEEKKDLVALSSQAKDFSSIRAALKNAPDVREDKVSDLTQKIQSGNYNVKSTDVAEKILSKYFV